MEQLSQTKQLTPLEAFQLFCKELKIENSEFAIIVEKALKREESIEITAIDIEQDNKELCKENKKLKRVLEIIKEKNVNLGLIKISKSVEEYNKWALVNNLFVDIDQRTLTQEEYDLLKEVLL